MKILGNQPMFSGPLVCSNSRNLLCAALLLFALGVPRVFAEVNKKELQAAKEKIEVLLHEAEALQERGRKEAAADHRREAEMLKKRLEDFYSEQKRHQDDDLRARRVEERAGRSEEERRGRDREQARAREQLEVMRVALRGLEEAEKGELADLMRKAIRAREVGLEGRRDAEAAEIRKQSPSRGALAEILGVASNVWAEFGHEKESELVDRLARTVGASVRQRDNREVNERREERREREPGRAKEKRVEEREGHRRDGDRGEVRERKIVRNRNGVLETEITREVEGHGERKVEREIVRERGHGTREERGKHLGHRIELIERRLEALRTMMESLQEDLRELRHHAVEEHL